MGTGIAVVASGLLLAALRPSDATGPRGPSIASPSIPTAGSGDGWAAWTTDADGRPLRWDPCTPVGFVLRTEGAPIGAEEDLRTALARLAAATGLELRLLGPTEERPARDRSLVTRSRRGWDWAPVLVAWDEPGGGGIPLGPHDRGVALPVAVRDGDRHAFVTGQVVLNAARSDLQGGFQDRADAWGATLLHELGHLLGLALVDDLRECWWADALEPLLARHGIRLRRDLLADRTRTFSAAVKERGRRMKPVTGSLHRTLDRLETTLQALH
jgi:hypothetical protein